MVKPLPPLSVCLALAELAPVGSGVREACKAAGDSLPAVVQALRPLAGKMPDGNYPIPYRWGGKGGGPVPSEESERERAGLDCSGFACYVAHRLGGLPIGEAGNTDWLLSVGTDSTASPGPGDLYLWGSRPGDASHVRVLVGLHKGVGIWAEAGGEGSTPNRDGAVCLSTFDAALAGQLGLRKTGDSRLLLAVRRLPWGTHNRELMGQWLAHLSGRGLMPGELSRRGWRDRAAQARV